MVLNSDLARPPAREAILKFIDEYRDGLARSVLPSAELKNNILSIIISESRLNVPIPSILEMLASSLRAPPAPQVAMSPQSQAPASTAKFPRMRGIYPDASDPNFDIGKVLGYNVRVKENVPARSEAEATRILLELEDMDGLINKKMQKMIFDFTYLTPLNNTETRWLCERYYDLKSTPMRFRLAFFEWESKQIEVKIADRVSQIEKKLREETEGIRNEYKRKFEEEVVQERTTADDLLRQLGDVQAKLRQEAELHNKTREELRREKESRENMKGELEMLRKAKSTVDQEIEEHLKEKQKLIKSLGELEKQTARIPKLEEQTAQIKSIEEQNTKLLEENTLLKKRFKASWILDVNATPEKPRIVNISDGDIVQLPPLRDFRSYILKNEKDQDDNFVYSSPDQTHQVPIPPSLYPVLGQIIAALQKTPAEKVSLTPTKAEPELPPEEPELISKQQPRSKPLSKTEQQLLATFNGGISQTAIEASNAADVDVTLAVEALDALSEEGYLTYQIDNDAGRVYSMRAHKKE